MAMVDIFVILKYVQFEKNGFQNRFKYKDKWVTKAVKNGMVPIHMKRYVDGTNLLTLNTRWIEVIKDTLEIRTAVTIEPDFLNGDMEASRRLAVICKNYGGTQYITNPTALDKYLDPKEFKARNIEIVPAKVPKHLNKSIFEMFEEYGVDGTIKQLPKRR